MTPKEKAKELALKYWKLMINYQDSKQCALIAVEEILKTGLLSRSPVKHQAIADVHEEYWNQVKTEIEKL